jgi:hypothetical protein
VKLFQRRLVTAAAAVGIALTAGVAYAPAALAHEGHGSCGQQYRAFLVPLAQAGVVGEIVSGLAQDGILNEVVADIHGGGTFGPGCEPRP